MISNPSQLIALLNKLPGQIRDQEKLYQSAKLGLEHAKLALSIAKSKAILESEGNATEKNAYANKVTEQEQRDVIEAQGKADMEEIELKYLENRFISLRKISSLEVELIKSQLSGS